MVTWYKKFSTELIRMDTAATLMELKNAFDTVNFSMLLEKPQLNGHGWPVKLSIFL